MSNRTKIQETNTQTSTTTTTKTKNTNTPKNTDSTGTAEVLYQKMGDRWFAFTTVDNEVFVGSISQEEIDRLEAKNRSKEGNA